MAGARPLLFLYPQLLRAAARSPYSSATGPRTWDAATAAATARAGRAKSSFAPRHGKGVEPAAWEQKQKGAQELEQEAIMMPPPPPPPPSQPQSAQPAAKEADAAAAATTTTTTSNATGAASTDAAEAKGGREQQQQAPVAPELEIRDGTAAKAKAGAEASKSSATEAGKTDAEEGAAQPPQQQQQQQPQQQAKGKEGDEKGPRPSGPLDEVLLMQAPEHTPPQHPHMSPPPYVHHFDSYSLVKQLQEGGYSQEQATTAMKAIRTLLAQNLDVAQKSLVSKRDVSLHGSLLGAGHRDQEQQEAAGRADAPAEDAPAARGGHLDAVAQPGAADADGQCARHVQRPQDGGARGAKGGRQRGKSKRSRTR
ncbi:hypothetical protein VFPFJ_05745 [Purpureocillium lilacinum]|uniref:Uncharacterized protein n=1 Tax=Purpureocillium lilacinum TaxID=33203 RepID=A0A179HG14_PURLI|nr:hypothetical protein VFPFJ_05745 [Purpureocillium lilacinum]OAQ89336.1 hypothetical protein VFPFJ_05745 [Purpureocillium lilacinum]